MLDGNKYIVPDQEEIFKLIKTLKIYFSVKSTSPIQQKVRFFDTFSWDLFKSKKCVYSVDDKIFYQTFNNRKTRLKILLEKYYSPSYQFPENEIYKTLKKTMKNRALIKMAKWDLCKKTYVVRNKKKIKICESCLNSAFSHADLHSFCIW